MTTDPNRRLRLLIIDNYDSFTWNLHGLLEELGASVDVVPNDRITVDEVTAWSADAVIISPGPGGPGEAGVSLQVCRSEGRKRPLFGLCLGHQAIAESFGGIVRRAKEPRHGKTSPIEHLGVGIFRNLPDRFRATRYHSLVVDEASLPAELRVTAWSDGEVMALRHATLPIESVQFHPESIASEHGKALFGRWLGDVRRDLHGAEGGLG